jgi:hypothetical protein
LEIWDGIVSKRKPLPPRAKRLNRKGRLAAAHTWLSKFDGKNVLRGYCKHFAVDWRCGAIELQMLGAKLDPAYLAQRDKAETIQKRQAKKQQAEAAKNEHWHPYTDMLSAYRDGAFEALHDLQLRQMADEHESISSQQDSPPF